LGGKQGFVEVQLRHFKGKSSPLRDR